MGLGVFGHFLLCLLLLQGFKLLHIVKVSSVFFGQQVFGESSRILLLRENRHGQARQIAHQLVLDFIRGGVIALNNIIQHLVLIFMLADGQGFGL